MILYIVGTKIQNLRFLLIVKLLNLINLHVISAFCPYSIVGNLVCVICCPSLFVFSVWQLMCVLIRIFVFCFFLAWVVGRGMSFDLLLKPSCGGCGSSKDLYGSNCKHLTLCLSCGKTMAENHAKCYECGATITRLIRVHLFHLSL